MLRCFPGLSYILVRFVLYSAPLLEFLPAGEQHMSCAPAVDGRRELSQLRRVLQWRVALEIVNPIPDARETCETRGGQDSVGE